MQISSPFPRIFDLSLLWSSLTQFSSENRVFRVFCAGQKWQFGEFSPLQNRIQPAQLDFRKKNYLVEQLNSILLFENRVKPEIRFLKKNRGSTGSPRFLEKSYASRTVST